MLATLLVQVENISTVPGGLMELSKDSRTRESKGLQAEKTGSVRRVATREGLLGELALE